jgi:hypothetical protein
VATSGGYQRYYTVAGRRHSHLLDPRTGRPAGEVAGATVVAPDNVTANALATALCVLTPAEGLRLVAATPGAECLLVDRAGTQFRSAGLPALEVPLPGRDLLARADPKDDTPKKDPPKDDKPKEDARTDAWPEGCQVTIGLELPTVKGFRVRRPYVAVWLEDARGKTVRTISVWGNSPKYLRTLTDWWKVAGNDSALVRSVTRATRGPGKYEVVWDGKDNKGDPLPQGTYTVRVEVHREHGKHFTQTGEIKCGADADKVTLEKNAETEATVVEYGKKK